MLDANPHLTWEGAVLFSLMLGCLAPEIVTPASSPLDLANDEVVCMGLESQRRPAPIEAVLYGMDSRTRYPIVEVDPLDESRIDGLALLGGQVGVCMPELARIDLTTGAVESTGISCHAVADFAGGIVLFMGCDTTPERCDRDGSWRDPIRWYPTWDDVLADTNGLTVPAVPYATRLGRGDDAFLSAWHSTDEIEVWDTTTGAQLDTVHLKGFDTWVWGLSAVRDRLFVVNDGREPGYSWNTRIAEFDMAGGAVLDLRLGEHVGVNGLACTGSLVDAGTVVEGPVGDRPGAWEVPGAVVVDFGG